MEALGNVSRLELPQHPAGLLASVRALLRARQRQHETRALLLARDVARGELAALAERLERRVSERTTELADANERLREEARERADAEERVRQMQSVLVHVSRLSAMNAMASTIAHELNQPLTAIIGFMRGIERMLARHGEAEPVLIEAVAANAHRAGETIRRLRDLVANQAVERRPESLASVIREATQLGLIDAAARGVTFEVSIAEDADVVMIDRIQIQQVLINLFRNALEAVAGRSRRFVSIGVVRLDRECVEVGVEDSGPGVPVERRELIFSPFNSTKQGGLGIGLSICRTIVEAHGGAIGVRDGLGGDCRFFFTLPSADMAVN